MRILTIFFLIILVACINACSFLPASPPKWEPQKEGIVLHLKSDNKLNVAKGKAYTLYFVIYQLTNPNVFNQLSEDEEGLSKLLASKIFDPSVTAVKSIVIYPGSDVTYKIDRAEGARYVGVVAGYRTMTKERMVRLFDIPVHVKIDNVLKMTQKLAPGVLDIKLKLGPQQIEKLKEKE